MGNRANHASKERQTCIDACCAKVPLAASTAWLKHKPPDLQEAWWVEAQTTSIGWVPEGFDWAYHRCNSDHDRAKDYVDDTNDVVFDYLARLGPPRKSLRGLLAVTLRRRFVHDNTKRSKFGPLPLVELAAREGGPYFSWEELPLEVRLVSYLRVGERLVHDEIADLLDMKMREVFEKLADAYLAFVRADDPEKALVIEKLPTDQRIIMLIRKFDVMPHDELAKHLGMTVVEVLEKLAAANLEIIRARDVAVATAIEKWPLRLRIVILIQKLDGTTHAEIAEYLKIAPITSRHMGSWAMKTLGRELKQEN